MRSNASTVEDAWALVVAGAEPHAVRILTDVSPISIKRMRAALKKLAEHAPECVPARMTWKDAAHAASALTAERQQTRTLANALRNALGSYPVPVHVLAEALAMTNATLPGALTNTWANKNGTRGVRHHETQARN